MEQQFIEDAPKRYFKEAEIIRCNTDEDVMVHFATLRKNNFFVYYVTEAIIPDGQSVMYVRDIKCLRNEGKQKNGKPMYEVVILQINSNVNVELINITLKSGEKGLLLLFPDVHFTTSYLQKRMF